MIAKREIYVKKKIVALFIAAMFPFSLTACGGGGGGSPSTGSTPTPPTPPGGGGSGGGNQPGVVGQSSYKDASNADRAAHSNGDGVTLGINDTGIDTHNKGLVGAKIEPKMYHYNVPADPTAQSTWSEEDTANVDKQHSAQDHDHYYHGTEMAQIAYHTAKDLNLIAADGLGMAGTSNVMYEGAEKLSTKAPIISNSWGTETYDESREGQLYWAEQMTGNASRAGGSIYNAIAQNGALWLQATGNDGKHATAIDTLVPLVNPELEKGFIAVGAVDNENSTTKAFYGNDCGAAAQWCVVAPADFNQYNEDGSQTVYSGTSNSTAYTAAVAGMVKGRYNWMTNENLKQVILGTATDLGDAGVDSVFGWGRVDKNKALGGYGQFSWGTSSLNVTSGISYFDNNIFGTGGFDKSGAGTLVLNGDHNTFTGSSTVTDGELVLNGQNKAAMTVGINGKLTVGDNSIGISSGSVTNNGVLNSETARDYVINGDYTQSNTGTLNKYIGSKLDITGVASLDGNLNITGKVVGYVTHTGTDYNILTAANGVNGVFSNVAFTSALLAGTVNYGTNSVAANLTRADATSAGATGQSYSNRVNTASQIDKVLNVLDQNYANGTLTNAQYGFYQSMVAPENATALNKQVFNLDRSIYNNNLYNASLESLESNKFLASQLTQNKDGVWVNYRYSNARTQFDGIHGKKNNNTVDIGGTKTLGDTQTIGAQLSIGDENWTDKFQGLSHESDTDKYNLSIAYNKRIKDINIYGIANYAWLDSKIKTDISKKIDGKQYGFGVGINKQFNVKDRFYITPDLMVQYLNTTGDDVHGVVYDAKTKQVVASFTVTLGYHINKNWSAYVKAGVDRDLQQDNTSVNEYVGVRVDNSVDLPKTRYSSRIGLAYRPTDQLEVGAEYRYSGNNHWNENAANVYLKYKF